MANSPGNIEIVVAHYDFNPTSPDELSFKRRDRMRILDKSDESWWKVVHLETKKEGLIPSNYVALTETLLTDERSSSEDTLRQKAENLAALLKSESEKVTAAPHGRHSVASYENSDSYIAIYDFNPASQEELSFMKGDKLQILDKSDNEWWAAIHSQTKVEGSVPSNFIVPAESVQCEEWFHGKLPRHEAVKLLMTSETGDGTFLIRSSDRITGHYALSLKQWNGQLKDYMVRHYVIKGVSGKYSIVNTMQFDSLQELVAYYSEESAGLATRLITPCPKAQPHLWDLSSELKDNWEANRDEYEMTSLLGEGNFGQVWLGNYKGQASVQVAIKTLKPGMMMADVFMAEASIMKTLRHLNLVSLYAVCSIEPLWIITEYMPYGSLLTYLRNEEGRHLPLNILLDIAVQIAYGMAYVESLKLIHRDLRAKNVLVGDNNLVKIADFGLARVVKNDVYHISTGIKSPIKWIAPEVLIYQQCTIKSDVWSFGIVLMEIVTHGTKPYKGMSSHDVQLRVPMGYRMPRPTNHPCPKPLYDLMKKCWHEDPDERPTFEYLYSFLNDFDVSKHQSA